MRKPRTAIMASNVPFYDGDIVEYVYGARRVEQLRQLTTPHSIRVTAANLEAELPRLADLEVIFSCWGMPRLTGEHLDRLPKLKAVFYAGGSVGGFAAPLLERGITVCNAIEANAIPVAEFCLAQILLACKGAYGNSQLCRRGPWDQSRMPVGKGVYGETVALLGIGAISRHLLTLLKPFKLRVVAVSGYLSGRPEGEVRAMGIDQLVSLDDAFSQAYVVSNHLPNRDDNHAVLTGAHFASMRENATFINTGRGAQVDEPAMVKVLKERPDLTALLDVQHPEPPAAGSELFTLPNVHLTSHIAGSANDEVQRMADFMLEDFQRWRDGAPLLYQVDPASQAARA